MRRPRILFLIPALLLPWVAPAQTTVPVPVVTATNLTFRVMAANLSSGTNQRYETPGLNIFKGLKPDVVCIQEFNYASTSGKGINTTAAILEMVTNTFGTNFTYCRETNAGYAIPNGIISRWPIVTNGSWDDPSLSDRGFAWARIDLPGTNDLYVVSVHLWSGGTATDRGNEANLIKSRISTNFPTGAWVIVGGDFNTDVRSEAAVDNFKTFLSDSPIPTDKITAGDPDTNEPRNKPYDYVLPSFSLTNRQVPVVIGTNNFTNGLVFDSAVYNTNYTLAGLSPIQSTDSHVTGMQHMGVIKDFRIPYLVTNIINVVVPVLTINTSGVLRWSGTAGLTYSVQSKTNLALPGWPVIGTATSATTNFAFTNNIGGTRFFRVAYP